MLSFHRFTLSTRFFIDENRTAYSGTDRIRAMLDQHEVEYSRIIYTYDEYRNILYGNATSTEFRRIP